MDIYNIIFYRFIDVFFSLRWMWIIAIILIYKLGKRYLEINAQKISLNRDELVKSEYNEAAIIGHLDYIINEALDQYVIFQLQPKNIYYINSKIETEIIEFLTDKVPDRISFKLMQQLELIYNRNFIPEFIGSRIYMIVLNYVLDYNINNSPDDNTKNATDALKKNK